jgi:uncharacterized membrane protein YuzA (DUF378 family)
MSGGPIFGTRFAADRLEYGIIGIQSAWETLINCLKQARRMLALA